MAISTALPQTNIPHATPKAKIYEGASDNDPRTRTERRYERKFAIYELDLKHIEMVLMLNPAAFTSIYKPRYINNIYLDTPQRNSFHQNIEGATPRKKARIRWYGDLTGHISNPVLEFKIKNGLTGFKISLPLSPFHLGNTFTQDDLERVLKSSVIPEDIQQELDHLEPALLNRYHRSYYLSGSKNVRATIDSQLTFYDPSGDSHPFEKRPFCNEGIILETKYAPEDDPESAAIASAFPFRVTKFSKYVAGILQITA